MTNSWSPFLSDYGMGDADFGMGSPESFWLRTVIWMTASVVAIRCGHPRYNWGKDPSFFHEGVSPKEIVFSYYGTPYFWNHIGGRQYNA